MIGLTRHTGERCCLHPNVIQRVEAAPDTVVFLTDGTHYCVLETVEQVVQRIRDDRAGDIAACYVLDRGESADPRVRAVQELLGEVAESHPFPVGQRY